MRTKTIELPDNQAINDLIHEAACNPGSVVLAEIRKVWRGQPITAAEVAILDAETAGKVRRAIIPLTGTEK